MSLIFPYTTLYNLTNTVFNFFRNEEKEKVIDLLERVLLVMDIRVNWPKRILYYQETADDLVEIKYDESQRIFPHKYKITPITLDSIDIHSIECILEEYDTDIVGKLSVIFDILGYVLINQEGRWRIKWTYDK